MSVEYNKLFITIYLFWVVLIVFSLFTCDLNSLGINCHYVRTVDLTNRSKLFSLT